MFQVETFFREIEDGAGTGMMMTLSSFKPALAIDILVCYLPSYFGKAIQLLCRRLVLPRPAWLPPWEASRKRTPVRAVEIFYFEDFLLDITPLIWSHEAATSRFTEEEEKCRNLEIILKAVEHNKVYISDIMVGLEQFGAVWQFV